MLPDAPVPDEPLSVPALWALAAVAKHAMALKVASVIMRCVFMLVPTL